MARMSILTRAVLVPVLLGPALAHDDPVQLVLEGDTVLGVGNVTSISNLVVNDAGQVIGVLSALDLLGELASRWDVP